MQIIYFFIVYWALMSNLLGHESWKQKVKRMDNEPNSMKSDGWKREHGLIK